ncbi:MAG: class I tRNA ligase family protein, partial [Clostridia bacterium]|nr:class I tRNA ligase family protein [Clostridia bacterium]
LAAYRIPETARAFEAFIDELSNWYVRRCRERFWAKGMEDDKVNAYMTLYTALVTVSKLVAPMLPFMAEEIYQNLVARFFADAPESVHLCDYPICDESKVDLTLEKDMEEVLQAVILGRACRNAANIKTRQPLAQMFVKAETPLPQFCTDIIAQELNVKKAILTDDVSAFTSYTFKPQLKTVGPKYGKYLGQIREALANLDGQAAMADLNSKGFIELPLSDVTAQLTKDDLLISAAKVDGFVADSDRAITVVLDTRLSDELVEEGFVRELISKVQTMRKDSGFEVTDHIRLAVCGNEKVAALMQRNEAEILSEVLGEEVLYDKTLTHVKEWNVNGEVVTLSVEKL